MPDVIRGNALKAFRLFFLCCGFVQILLNKSRFYLLFTFRFVSVFLTQGSCTSKPPKRKAILMKVPQKGQLIFRKMQKNVRTDAVLS